MNGRNLLLFQFTRTTIKMAVITFEEMGVQWDSSSPIHRIQEST